ncbi:MAG: EI24 domain-containing protein [Myxococcaceae bacterium]
MAMPAALVPVLSARGEWSEFLVGFGLPFRSFKLLFRSKALFLLALASSLVTLVALVGLVVLLGSSIGDLVGLFWARPESWYALAAWYLVATLAFLVLLVVGVNTIPLLLLSPLQDPMSEATEELCGSFTAPPFSFSAMVRGSAIAVVHSASRIAFLLGGHLVLLPLNFIPGAGSVLWTVGGSVWTMYWVAGEYLGGPMARHHYPFREVRKAMASRRALTMGFGAAVYLLLWVPLLNLFFIPLAIVGGTLLFRSLRDGGHIPKSTEAPGVAGQSLDAPLGRD